MTFEEFQASRREIDDVSLAGRHGDLSDEAQIRDAGFEYATGFFISKVGSHWPEEARAEGAYHLIIGNQEWIDDDLANLERILYDCFAAELLEDAI